MALSRSTEVTVKVDDVHALFSVREFDPFNDDVESVKSIAAIAQLPHLVAQLKDVRLRVLLPAAAVTPQTESLVQRAFARYCAHMIAEARRKLAAMRWVGLRTLAIGIVFFGLSLAASTAVGRALFIPEGLRTLASESLIVAGWVVIWQPLDTLVQGWWPQWQEERTFRAIGALPLRVESY
jgi:hypothetical protein